MNNNKLSLLVVLLLALFAGISWGANQRMDGQRQPDYTVFSRGEYGISLFYDTLRHMRHTVGILYRPVGDTVSVNDTVLIVQPSQPRPNERMAEDILTWVQRGGRLIYLENAQPNIMDRVLRGEYYTAFGSLRWYRHGMGEIVTGRANTIINRNLMEDPAYGEGLAYVLAGWNPERIYFAEYYHGFQREQSNFSQMPAWIQLVAIQIMISVIALMWHLGKRFGKPVPFYEEVEREEDAQIYALARLYKQADKLHGHGRADMKL